MTHSHELIQGVEFHKLDACLVEYLFSRYFLEDGFKHALGARIAIASRVAKEFVLCIEQAVIDAPRVKAHTV